MKLWYNRVDEGEVISKKELINDFYFYFWFSLLFLITGFLTTVFSIQKPELIGPTIILFYLTLSYENNMRAIKQFYREQFYKKKELK